MLDPQWTAVDRALAEWLVPEDEALEAALDAATRAGLPAIHVSPTQGKWLQLIAAAIGARRILEIGTLAGYSTIWLARALPPGGRLVSLEIDPGRAALARENLERAGLGSVVEVRVGAALASLERLREEQAAPFDFVFIDADKVHCAEYLDRSTALARRGAVIVVDNVVRNGRVVDAESDDPNVIGVRRMLERLSADPRLDASALQTVGAKGYDGMVMAVVRSIG